VTNSQSHIHRLSSRRSPKSTHFRQRHDLISAAIGEPGSPVQRRGTGLFPRDTDSGADATDCPTSSRVGQIYHRPCQASKIPSGRKGCYNPIPAGTGAEIRRPLIYKTVFRAQEAGAIGVRGTQFDGQGGNEF